MTPENARLICMPLIDGELDAASTMELEVQLRESPGVATGIERLSALQSLVRNRASRFDAFPTWLVVPLRPSLRRHPPEH